MMIHREAKSSIALLGLFFLDYILSNKKYPLGASRGLCFIDETELSIRAHDTGPSAIDIGPAADNLDPSGALSVCFEKFPAHSFLQIFF